ncbi:MAG: LysE family translocator [Desulfobacteraceae bacterium]|nr:LysE family translocator [Desulfobacteraceae bacterium]
MTATSIASFALAMFFLALSPGPGVFAIVARAISHGYKSALIMIVGLILGDIIYLLFAAFGLSVTARAMGSFFILVKICGGAYLIYLGVKTWLSKADSSPDSSKNSMGLGTFSSGFVISLSNPKVIFFYCGFLPTFFDLQSLTIPDLLIIIAVLIGVISSVAGTYAYLASRSSLLFKKKKNARRLNRVAGGTMVAAGVVIAAQA